MALCAPTGRGRAAARGGHRARRDHHPPARRVAARRGPAAGSAATRSSATCWWWTSRACSASTWRPCCSTRVGRADPRGADRGCRPAPPVGAGKPFADLIESGRVPVARLTHVFRQAARSLIVQAAHAINARRAAADPGRRGGGARLLLHRAGPRRRTPPTRSCTLATERLPSHYGLDPIRDVQVLAPIYRGAVGVDALNERLRARLNPDGAALPGRPAARRATS